MSGRNGMWNAPEALYFNIKGPASDKSMSYSCDDSTHVSDDRASEVGSLLSTSITPSACTENSSFRSVKSSLTGVRYLVLSSKLQVDKCILM